MYDDVDLIIVRAVQAVRREPDALLAITFDNFVQVRIFAGAKFDVACRLSIFEHCRLSRSFLINALPEQVDLFTLANVVVGVRREIHK